MNLGEGLAIVVVVFFIVLAIGLPIGIALAGCAGLGLIFLGGPSLFFANLQAAGFYRIFNYTFAVVPLFIWMGYLGSLSAVVEDLYFTLAKVFSRVRGQLIYATIAGGTLFGAASGSTIAAVTLFTKISLPEMTRYGYHKRLAAGAITSAGTLAALIPPSIPMIVFGLLTESPIGALLIGGIVPGVILATLYAVTTQIVIWFRPNYVPAQDKAITYTWKERMERAPGALGLVAIFVIVMGGIYGGFFTPTQAGAIGATAAFLLIVVRRRFKWKLIWQSLVDSGLSTSRIFLIIIGGTIFARYLAFSGLSIQISSYLVHLNTSPLVILLMVVVLYTVFGMFLDGTSLMVLTLPVTYPVMIALGYEPVWFGVVVVMLVELGSMTPPVGVNAYSVVAASEGVIKTEDVFIGLLPFMVSIYAMLALVIAFPQLILWLPGLMGKGL